MQQDQNKAETASQVKTEYLIKEEICERAGARMGQSIGILASLFSDSSFIFSVFFPDALGITWDVQSQMLITALGSPVSPLCLPLEDQATDTGQAGRWCSTDGILLSSNTTENAQEPD